MDLRALKNIFKFLSVTGMALSLFFLLPLLTGIRYHEDIAAFAIFDALLFSINAFFYLVLRKHTLQMSIRDGILSVNLVWVLLGFGGAVPLILYTPVSWADGFFEAISGFTTTGATIYTDIESLPKTILMLRSLMHWLGGMGIIVLGVGLFSLINPTGSMALFKAESTGIKMEKMTPKIKDTAFFLWGVYLLFTLCDTAALHLAGMDWFDSINHAFSTISTGGFSTKNASLGYFDSPLIFWITTFFMIVSGINFLAHLKLLSGGSFDGYRREEVFWYLLLFFALSFALTLVVILIDHDNIFHAATHAFFTIASILTTTGFATLDYEQWGHLAVSIVFIAMLIGGNAGSTAGGMKVIRYIVMWKTLVTQLKKTIHPHAMVNIFIDEEKTPSSVINATTGFVLLFIMTNLIVSIYLFSRGYDALTAVSTALACVGNVGPGFALTGPAQNYAFFHSSDKILLAFAMIAGRLEFYTIALLLTKTFWKKF